MPRLLKTLSQYAVERKKEETYFMVFNTVYNDLYAFKNEPNSEENAEYGIFGYLNEKCVNNIETLVFYPDFKKHKRVYHFRNRQIVIQSNLIVAFWNGYSTGTKYTINFAKTLEKEVIVVKY